MKNFICAGRVFKSLDSAKEYAEKIHTSTGAFAAIEEKVDRKNYYFAEITDTFSGEANYSWVRRYIVRASSDLGAVNVISRHYGAGWRAEWSTGETTRYNLQGAAVCMFISYIEEEEVDEYIGRYSRIENVNF